VGEPAGILERVVGPTGQFGDSARGESSGVTRLLVASLGHRLGAVLAELEGRHALLVRPRAAGAVEAVGFFGARQQRVRQSICSRTVCAVAVKRAYRSVGDNLKSVISGKSR
jgi:hypothetical protein